MTPSPLPVRNIWRIDNNHVPGYTNIYNTPARA